MDDRERHWERQLPPWKVFPAFTPSMLPATQGAEESWFDEEWRPFWASLSPLERHAYLDHWDATEEWRDALEFFFSKPPEFDSEADAHESAAYLRQQGSVGKRKRSLWKRLTGRF
jgi:hypothetical protein